jgi:flagellar biosynthetic protein FliR
MTIESFLVTELFTFLLIFTRISAGFMLLPGIGEAYVSLRIRLLFSIMVAIMLMPLLGPSIPPVPTSPLALSVLMMKEIIIGLFFGLLARFLLSAMHVAGMVISYQSSLAAATMFDVSQAGQGSTIGNFLSVTAVLLLFVTDLHHLMIQGLVDSYTLFEPGAALMIGDMADSMTRLTSDVFNIGVKLASPIIAVALMVNLGAGVLARLMPNMQVFFVLIPAQIQIALLFLMTTLSGMYLWYLDFVEIRLTNFLGG